jgi:hypothetical protein
MRTRWGGLILGAVAALSMVGIAAAQDDQKSNSKDQGQDAVKQDDQKSKDQELEAIKKRLEALEQEKAQRDAAASDEHGADPAEAKWYDRVKVGGGVRASFRSQEDLAPNGRTYSYGFNLDSARLYTGGKIVDIGTSNISATLNAEFTETTIGGPANGFSALDAIAQFNIQDEFNIWMGRMLPACDRSDSDGPYYLIAWDFPETSIAFNRATNGFGRDDGITIWGDVKNFKYWVGAYSGLNNTTNSADHLLYAARIQYDFLDQEKGYYLLSTNHGKQSILALGAAVNYQSATSGVPGDPKNTTNFEIDALFEKKFEFGVPTIEMAYYYYGRGGYGGIGSGGFGGFVDGQGQAFMTTVAWLIPYKVGWGEFQPLVRYQGYDEKKADSKNAFKNNYDRWDVGVNYVMDGHNARISIIYSVMNHHDLPALTSDKADHLFTIGSQVQF